MKKIFLLHVLIAVLACCSSGQDVFIEAESMDEYGGWCLDQQFMDIMGSPYLIAHGLGKPVEDASCTLELPSSGKWHVFVRTYNWTSPWSNKLGKSQDGAGKFEVLVGGKSLGKTLGCSGQEWEWQYAGEFVSGGSGSSGSFGGDSSKGRRITLALHDLTGFDGRCDAILISKSRHPSLQRPQKPDPTDGGTFDLVVAGGGVAGMCAAIAASRQGLKVALVHDRPVLGGNNSAEVRVHLGGMIRLEPYPALGNILNEFGHTVKGNAQPAENYADDRKMAIVSAEENITLLLNTRINEVVMADENASRIAALVGENISTGERVILHSPLFADCTGDGCVGALAGADFSYGRESKSTYGESSAPETADSMVLGTSVQWYSVESGNLAEFPLFEYGLEFCDESAQRVTHGEWTWETGMNRDQIASAERIRDYGLMVVYSNWSYLKNKLGLYPDRSLEWVAYIAGKRESRRLLGDIVLTENDLITPNIYPDGTASISWSIDLHYPDTVNTRFFPGQEFKARCVQTPVDFYPIPYRCLYSRNIENLFMAGRNISVSHIALGTTRVMRTTAMLGEVVGLAASVCTETGCTPRGVYSDNFARLEEKMTKGAGDPTLPNTQTFNTGHKPATKKVKR